VPVEPRTHGREVPLKSLSTRGGSRVSVGLMCPAETRCVSRHRHLYDHAASCVLLPHCLATVCPLSRQPRAYLPVYPLRTPPTRCTPPNASHQSCAHTSACTFNPAPFLPDVLLTVSLSIGVRRCLVFLMPQAVFHSPCFFNSASAVLLHGRIPAYVPRT